MVLPVELESVVSRVEVEAGVKVEREGFELIPKLLYLLTDVLRNSLRHLQLLLVVIVHLLYDIQYVATYMILLGKVHQVLIEYEPVLIIILHLLNQL